MEPIPEHDSKQASQAEPTVEQMKRWKEDQLLQWIIEKRKETLDDGKIQKLKEAEITGEMFWTYAGDMHYFKNECNLPNSISVMLANLSGEFKERVTAGIKNLHPRTLCKLQANNVTENRQQAEDVEMSDAADMKSKLLSFMPCT